METFSRNLFEGLKEKNFLAAAAEPKAYATPRRLAVVITQVLEKQPDRQVERKGPAVATALDANGRPTPALIGFAKSCGVELAKLEKRAGDKGEYFVYSTRQKGEVLKQHLASDRRNRAQETADPQAHALGRGRGAVRAPGARRDPAARQQARAGHGARAEERQQDPRATAFSARVRSRSNRPGITKKP